MGTPGARASGIVASHSPAEIAAYPWQKLTEIAQDGAAQLPENTWLEVRFERLVEDPGGEIEWIAAFCELREIGPPR